MSAEIKFRPPSTSALCSEGTIEEINQMAKNGKATTVFVIPVIPKVRSFNAEPPEILAVAFAHGKKVAEKPFIPEI